MRIDHHPDDSTILAYAAGTVNEGFSLVLAAHLECCPGCPDRLADAEALGGVTYGPPTHGNTSRWSG